MAFPTVAATNTYSNGGAQTSHAINLPASIAAGDLLIMFLSVSLGSAAITTPSGWTLLKNKVQSNFSNFQASVFYKVASGSEGATVSVSMDNARCSGITYKITASTFSSTPQVSTAAQGSSGNANPDSLTPSGGAKDYLWIAVAADGNENFSGYPTSYSGSNLRIGTGGSNNSITTATRALNASSEDPGTFAQSGEWVAMTISIEGAAAPGPTNLKSLDTNVKANIKSYNTNVIANIKSINTNA